LAIVSSGSSSSSGSGGGGGGGGGGSGSTSSSGSRPPIFTSFFLQLSLTITDPLKNDKISLNQAQEIIVLKTCSSQDDYVLLTQAFPK
jgi:hypothetical protein